MDKIIGVEVYCHNCQHETRYDDEQKVNPDLLYACPHCGSEEIFRSHFITCECGTTVYLDSHTNECGNCERLYNAFGQELAPPESWDEQDRYDCFGPQNLPNEDW